MNTAEAVRDLIEEAKVRTLYWAICVFAICYFLSHTSKSMWMNIPISLLLVSALRILSNSVEFCWRVQSVGRQTYLSHLVKKQFSVSNSCLFASPSPHKWKRKIGCPAVESAVDVFVNKIMQDFVINLWYSDITPDKEAPELIDALIKDVLGEISGRVKELNIVELLTRDVVDLIGDHLDLFRRNQLAIGTDVISTLSTEERDERLKHHLIDSKELHPALISPECEYKVLQQLVGGILGVVLRPREAQCPLVRCIARELVASLVLQPVMNLACPVYINELIESIFLGAKHTGTREAGHQQSMTVVGHQQDHSAKGEDIENVEYMSGPYAASNDLGNDKISTNINDHIEKPLDVSGTSLTLAFHEKSVQLPPADWARGLDAATQRRTEVLMPENLEDMWSRGKKYNSVTLRGQARKTSGFRIRSVASMGNFTEEVLKARPRNSNETEEHALVWLTELSEDLNKELPFEIPTSLPGNGSNYKLKRSNSTSALKSEPNANIAISEAAGINSEFYNSNSSRHEAYGDKDTSNTGLHREALHGPKLRCRVLGAYFEKIGSKSFAVYYIEVSDSEANTWFVKRRYRNFERLHRQLKGIPNYILHLPPKRIFSSSTEDAFVHQRCIQLDKYLKDLLSIANVAEQHDVWDFLSDSSKNYSFGNPSSVMRTLAVNVDDAVDENLRQFKEVSNGLVSKVKASPHSEARPSIYSRNLSWHADDMSKHVSRQNTMDTENSFSDNEEGDEAESHGPKEFGCSEQVNRWHSDNELDSKICPPRLIKSSETRSLDHRNSNATILKSDFACPAKYHSETFPAISDHLKDPPEWTPPNVSVPLLNLVDKLFQLKKRGWLRRQVFWISKQILQLAMEDAIDDFLLRQINWLRREEVIAQGIRWVQDVLWPDGTFFLRLTKPHSNTGDFKAATRPAGRQRSKLGSFEAQLEASRRASDVKKIIFDGAPATLVSLIGYNQYNRSAKDVYYFLQSTVCVKQLAYGILEVALISVFPELRDLIVDIHIKMRPHCA